MSDYKAKWKSAKAKFEGSTGVKKPAPTKKNLFGKAVRQKVGIGETLGKFDKLMPASHDTPLDAKTQEQLGRIASQVGEEVRSYLDLLNDAINKEKDEHGKAAGSIYRDLKILRAELEAIVADVRADIDKIYAFRQAAGKDFDMAAKSHFTIFKTLKTSIDKNGKKALLAMQNILKDPTPATYNAAFPKAARDITQTIGQIFKYTMPDEFLNEAQQATKHKYMDNPKIAEMVVDLDKRVAHFKRETVPLMNNAGSTPMNSTLSKLCNTPIKFGEDASREDVIAAAKHFGRQVKTAIELGRKII